MILVSHSYDFQVVFFHFSFFFSSWILLYILSSFSSFSIVFINSVLFYVLSIPILCSGLFYFNLNAVTYLFSCFLYGHTGKILSSYFGRINFGCNSLFISVWSFRFSPYYFVLSLVLVVYWPSLHHFLSTFYISDSIFFIEYEVYLKLLFFSCINRSYFWLALFILILYNNLFNFSVSSLTFFSHDSSRIVISTLFRYFLIPHWFVYL